MMPYFGRSTTPRRCIPDLRILLLWSLFLCVSAAAVASDEAATDSSHADGYRGIWFTLGQYQGEFGDKYSGGLGTYTAKHVPIAVYSKDADKTFFVYGGTTRAGERHLLNMAGYYDHARGVVPRPTIVHDKGGVADPHDNASICLDGQGYVWVFISGRGRARPGFKYRGAAPLSTDDFELVSTEEMTYPQPWWLPDKGFLHLFTKYTHGRELYWETSSDGVAWSDDQKLAGFGGHYQVSGRHGDCVASAFNYHPGTVDKRTNLYFVQSADGGKRWTTVAGEPLDLPLADVDNPALVRDYAAEGLLVYMKDLTFDVDGHPIVLYVTSKDHRAGPAGDPRTWTIAHWTGASWEFHSVTHSDHNYDMGSLYIESDGIWRVIAPTAPGPQPYGTGGEMVAWTSSDQGRSWKKAVQLTQNSSRNHSYARRPIDAQPVFYAFWADGDPFEFSPSRLYFANKAGDQVRVLPVKMDEPVATPQRVAPAKPRRVPIAKGWARNAINAVIFRQNSVTTHKDTQYAAFYDADGQMVLAKRQLGSGDWKLHPTGRKGNVKDAHNTISIAVDGAGVLHVAWDHHGQPLHYAPGKAPGSLELTEQTPMTTHFESHVTYPEFFNLADGGLLFMYREGGSGRGNTMLNRYDLGTQTWSIVQHPLIDGENQRNAYTNQLAIDDAGVWHLSWCWRESGDVASNHDVCYARSADQGRTWTRSDGSPYGLPITAATAEVACPVPQKHEYINQCSTAVDAQGRPMIATYWRPKNTKVPQYHLVWYDGSQWNVSQVGQRKTAFSLSGGGTKRIPISRPKLAVGADGSVYMLFRDAERGDRVSVAVTNDPQRNNWRVVDLTDDSVGLWEPSYDAQLWRARGELHVFTQRVGQGDAETLEDIPPQMISILEWKP